MAYQSCKGQFVFRTQASITQNILFNLNISLSLHEVVMVLS